MTLAAGARAGAQSAAVPPLPESRPMRLAGPLAMLFVLLQIALGGAVRLTGSGLSCPDWPLCHGFWLPTPAALATVPDLAYAYWQVWLEWIHRVNAAILVAPLVFLVLLTAPTREQRVLGTAAAALVGVQAVLGAFTVLDRNSPWSVTVHLAAALVLLVLLAGASTRPRAAARARARTLPAAPWVAWTGVALAIAAAGAGAFLAKSGLAQTCPDWPLCGGPWTPAHYASPEILPHLVHRLLALAAVLPALILVRRLTWRRTPAAFTWSAAAIVLFVLQALLGLVTAVAAPEIWLALTHQVAGAVLVTAYAAAAWSVARAR